MSEGDLTKSEDLDAAWDDVPPPSLPISSAPPPSVSKLEIPEELDSGWDEPAAPRQRFTSRKRREPAPVVLAQHPVTAEVKAVGPNKRERRDQQRRNRAHADQRERERKAQRKVERREAAQAAQAEREKARAELEKARAKAARKAAKAKKQARAGGELETRARPAEKKPVEKQPVEKTLKKTSSRAIVEGPRQRPRASMLAGVALALLLGVAIYALFLR
jgi:hypothetical protein